MIKIIVLCILSFQLISGDGHDWVKQEETEQPLSEASSSSEASSESSSTSNPENPASNTENPATNSENPATNSTVSNSTESDPNSSNINEKPLKEFGCTTRLWTGGLKFCWTRCNSTTTSVFWSTWCFTTNSTGEPEQGQYVSCESDEVCQHDWKCKSSCGMFSPHWDRDTTIVSEATPLPDKNKA